MDLSDILGKRVIAAEWDEKSDELTVSFDDCVLSCRVYRGQLDVMVVKRRLDSLTGESGDLEDS